MDGRVFVELISRLRQSLKIHNVDDALNVINEISSNIIPSSFIQNSTLMDEVIANIFLHANDPKLSIALSCQTFLDRWLSFYSAFAPINFFRMINKHSRTFARCMFKALPPFVFAYKTYFDLHSDESMNSYLTIVESSEPQSLIPMTKQVWVLYRDNSTVDHISKLIEKLLTNANSSFAVSVLVRKCPEQLVEQVFQAANLTYILSFLQNLPLYVKFSVLTAAVKVADAIFCNMEDEETAYKIIPLIVKRKLDDVESVSFIPIWPKVMDRHQNYAALAAIYSAAKYDLYPKSEVILHLHFSDRSDSKVRLESIRIGFELLNEVPFRDNFIKILTDLSQTRTTPSFRCLIDHLTVYFPAIRDINSDAAYEIVNNALKPTPEGENTPQLVLRFLNSLDNLLDPKFTFDIANIIRHYSHLENSTNLIDLLKKLIYRLSLNIDSMTIDYFNPSSYMKLQLVDSIDPHILTEAIQLGLVPFHCLPFVVDKLRLPYCFHGALGSVILILNTIGFKINYKYDECWVTAEDVIQCVENLRVAFVVSEMGKVVASLLRLIVDLFDHIDIDSEIRSVLIEIAHSLSAAVPDSCIKLLIKLRESNISFTYASPKFYANYILTYGSPEQIVQKEKDKIVAACFKDYNLAKAYAPYLDQPFIPLPTYHAFEGLDKHKYWLELSREHFLPEQVITPIVKVEIPVKKFNLREVVISEGISGILGGRLVALIFFMYFSDKELPIKTEVLEDFVLKKKDDNRLFVGFFIYCQKHGYMTTRLEEWTETIKNNGSSMAYYAVSLFLHSIKVDLSNPPPCVLNFITKSLSLMGIVHFSKKSVAKAFLKNSGMKWYFIRSIISLDTAYFENYPLVMVEYASEPEEREKMYIEYFDSLGDVKDNLQKLVDIFISLSSIYFHTKITYNKFFFPTCHKNLLSFVTVPSYPLQVSFSEEFINSLLNLLEKQSLRLPSRFFSFFIQAKLTNSQYQRLRQIITPKTTTRFTITAFMFLLFPSLYFTTNPNKSALSLDDKDHFENRSPSFTRAFCRSLLIPIAPTLSQKFILDMVSVLTPVFPAFSYPLLPCPKDAPLYEKILLHAIEPTPEMFTIPSRETFFLFKAAMKYADPLKKNELTRSFLMTLVSESTHIEFVALSCHELKKISSIGKLITSIDVVNGSNFMLYCIMLRRVERMRQESWEEKVINKLKNDERRKVFAALGTKHIVKKLIACSQQ